MSPITWWCRARTWSRWRGNSPVAACSPCACSGPIGLLLASAAIMISVFGSLNGNMLVGPRLLYAMGKDGLAPHCAVPAAPALRHAGAGRRGAGGWSILLVRGMAAAGARRLAADKSLFDVLTDYAMFGAVVVRDAGGRVDLRVPTAISGGQGAAALPLLGLSVLPIFYVLVMAAVLVNMFVTDLLQSLSALGLVILGAVVYLLVFWGRTPTPRPEPAPVEPAVPV